jgi:hypothetical protein
LQNATREAERYSRLPGIKRFLFGSTRLKAIHQSFLEPITALQDDDWEPSDNVRFLFYSVYNLLEFLMRKRITVHGEPMIYVSINQAVACLSSSNVLPEEEIRKLLHLRD